MTILNNSMEQVTLVPRGAWEVDPARSTAGFTVRRLKVAKVRGRFRWPSWGRGGGALVAGLVVGWGGESLGGAPRGFLGGKPPGGDHRAERSAPARSGGDPQTTNDSRFTRQIPRSEPQFVAIRPSL